MNKHVTHPVEMAPNDDLPEGMIDYEARTAIRDLCRIYGFENAREKIAFYLLDEAERGARQ